MYDFTDEGYEEYLQTLPQFLTVQQIEEFIGTGRLERSSVDEDGSKAVTVHERITSQQEGLSS